MNCKLCLKFESVTLSKNLQISTRVLSVYVCVKTARVQLATLRETEEKIRRNKEAQEKKEKEKQAKMEKQKKLLEITTSAYTASIYTLVLMMLHCVVRACGVTECIHACVCVCVCVLWQMTLSKVSWTICWRR
jgi:uncharacterized protein (DUF2225 family)